LLVALAGCGGGGNSQALPATPAPIASTTAAIRGASTLSIMIKIPQKATAATKARAPRYVSYATQSIQINVDPGTANERDNEFDLTPSSPGCAPSGTFGYLTCSLSLALVPGSHTANAIMYDKTGGTAGGGAKLSASYGYPFTVTAGVANTLAFSLGGVATTFSVQAADPSEGAGNLQNGISLDPTKPVRFFVYALDADQNAIVGPDAPVISVRPPASGMTVTPVTGNPSAFDLKYTATQAGSSISLTLSATNSTGSSDPPLQRTLTATGALVTITATCVNSCYADDGNTVKLHVQETNSMAAMEVELGFDYFTPTGGASPSDGYVTLLLGLGNYRISTINVYNADIAAGTLLNSQLFRVTPTIYFTPPLNITYDSSNPNMFACSGTACSTHPPLIGNRYPLTFSGGIPLNQYSLFHTAGQKFKFATLSSASSTINGNGLPDVNYVCASTDHRATITVQEVAPVPSQQIFTLDFPGTPDAYTSTSSLTDGYGITLTPPATYTPLRPIDGTCTFQIADASGPKSPVPFVVPFHLDGPSVSGTVTAIGQGGYGAHAGVIGPLVGATVVVGQTPVLGATPPPSAPPGDVMAMTGSSGGFSAAPPSAPTTQGAPAPITVLPQTDVSHVASSVPSSGYYVSIFPSGADGVSAGAYLPIHTFVPAVSGLTFRSTSATNDEAAFLAQLNADRTSAGKPIVTFDEYALEAARQHVAEMNAGLFQCPYNTQSQGPQTRFDLFGALGAIGENVGGSTGTPPSILTTAQVWQNAESGWVAESGTSGADWLRLISGTALWAGTAVGTVTYTMPSAWQGVADLELVSPSVLTQTTSYPATGCPAGIVQNGS